MDARLARLAVPLGCLLAASGCGSGTKPIDAGAFKTAPHLKVPLVVDGGGGVLKPLRLVVVVSATDNLAPKLKAFGDALLGSQWWRAVGSDYNLGTPEPKAVVLSGPELKVDSYLSESDLTGYLQAAIAAAPTPPQPDGRTLYLLFVPQGGTFLYQGQANTNCSVVRGTFHAPFGARGDVWAPVMRCPFPSFQAEIDAVTMVASRAVADAATNPNGKGWRLSGDKGAAAPFGTVWAQAEGSGTVEVGGLCGPDLREPLTATRVVEGGVTYQRIFSISTAAAGLDPCAPPLPVPYYAMTTEQEWYQGNPGDTVSIPLTGWSTDPTNDWLVKVSLAFTSDPLAKAPNALLDGDAVVTIGITTYKTSGNGQKMGMRVNLPDTARSGFWSTFVVRSFRLDDKGQTPAGEDLGHRWLVGVNVP